MLTLNEQKKRLVSILNEHANLVWHENKAERYRVTIPSITKGSLWLRITKGSETIVVSSSGAVTSSFESTINKTIGNPQNKNGSHRDWFNVNFEKTKKIVNEFNLL